MLVGRGSRHGSDRVAGKGGDGPSELVLARHTTDQSVALCDSARLTTAVGQPSGGPHLRQRRFHGAGPCGASCLACRGWHDRVARGVLGLGGVQGLCVGRGWDLAACSTRHCCSAGGAVWQVMEGTQHSLHLHIHLVGRQCHTASLVPSNVCRVGQVTRAACGREVHGGEARLRRVHAVGRHAGRRGHLACSDRRGHAHSGTSHMLVGAWYVSTLHRLHALHAQHPHGQVVGCWYAHLVEEWYHTTATSYHSTWWKSGTNSCRVVEGTSPLVPRGARREGPSTRR